MAERRVCSVLFCDVVGFTPLSESRDPEAVRELLSRYFAVARTVIGRYGGVVEKFIGDAVMAVWGTPVAAEGDAERAVRAGLDLVSSVAELGAGAGVPGLAARAGVVTGEVAVTLGAAHEGMVAGDAVNTAARVQSAAQPGQVLADGATQRLAGGGVGFADAGEHRLKGKAEPQQLWRATRVLAGVGGVQRVDGLEAPLIGRDAELRTVKELFHAAAERRVPRLVLWCLVGGVGKSRLVGVREIRRWPCGNDVLAPGPVPVLTARAWRSGRWRPNRYKVTKQADTVMLFFLFRQEELREIFGRLGYGFQADTVTRNVAYYDRRTSHGSTLSFVTHAGVLAAIDPESSWERFLVALQSDAEDIQGGTTKQNSLVSAYPLRGCCPLNPRRRSRSTPSKQQ